MAAKWLRVKEINIWNYGERRGWCGRFFSGGSAVFGVLAAPKTAVKGVKKLRINSRVSRIPVLDRRVATTDIQGEQSRTRTSGL
jgi:hypothetical protein